MGNFFNNLKQAVGKIEQVTNEIQSIGNKVQNSNVNLKDTFTLMDKQVDTVTNLSSEYYNFDFLEVNYRYRKSNPTNFYISNEDFGAGEVCNTYFYSVGGARIEDVFTINTANATMITFGVWEYNPREDIALMNSYLNHYGLSNPKVEDIHKNDFVYKVTAESDTIYYEAYYLRAFPVIEGNKTESRIKIDLKINKEEVNEEMSIKLLSEFHSIIETFEVL